jgi:hypothetical protein
MRPMNGRREEIMNFVRCHQNTITKSYFFLAVMTAKTKVCVTGKKKKIIKEG